MLDPMVVLALDTSTRGGSVAVARDGALLESRAGDPALSHGRRLPAEIAAILRDHGLRPADVELYVVAAGPGSFTGLRVGIASIQGLAFANGRLVAPIPTLDAHAFAAATTPPRLGPGDHVAVWLDAQRGQVFAALFELRPAAAGEPGLVAVSPPSVGTPDEVLASWRLPPGRVRFTGGGVGAFRSLVGGLPGVEVIEPAEPIAATLARLAFRKPPLVEAVPPSAVRPLYIRRSDAEIARDRNAPTGGAASPSAGSRSQ
jgi:tRNA threonylcarbamoyladenosine biosynthesis protein TsaB